MVLRTHRWCPKDTGAVLRKHRGVVLRVTFIIIIVTDINILKEIIGGKCGF